jgi:hypothetical protein
MGKKAYPSDVVQQAQDVLLGWNQITPVPTFGSMTAATFTADLTATTTLDTQIKTLEAQLTDNPARMCGTSATCVRRNM